MSGATPSAHGGCPHFRFLAIMNTRPSRFIDPALRTLCIAALASLAGCNGDACFGVDVCFNDNNTQPVALSGTAAAGGALASVSVTVSCAQGSATTLTDGGGNYRVTVNAVLPCVITVASGGTSLHSLAYGGGTFNTTPETELMLVYLAAQLGTNTGGLIGNFQGNARFQQAMGSPNTVQAAQSAVVANLQQRYSVTLSTPAFLTTPFVVGQPGVSGDLDALAKAGAIDPNGLPDPVAVSLLQQAGAAHPL
ncbi:putative lipoprotein [Burkholderia latens]|nr:putative lipoprotein [Burkholderia latens]